MKYDRLYNFISPVTGKLPIDKGYILLGDKEGRSFTSPVLIDVRQDIIDLKRQIGNFEELKKLDHNRIWIGDFENEAYPQLHIGIINLPPLAEALFPNPASSITGDFRIPNPTFDYTSAFDWVMSGPFLPQIYATSYDIQGNPIGTDISSSLAMTQVRSAQIMKRFDNADFIVGSSTVTFAWENPKMYLIPEALKQLYGLGTTYTFTKAQSLGALETGLLKNTVNNKTGTLSKAIAGVDYVDITNLHKGYPIILDPLYPVTGSKLIAPILSFSYRKNKIGEFNPVADTIDVFDGIAAKFIQLAITGVAGGSLLKVNNDGEIIEALPDIDYITTLGLAAATSAILAAASLSAANAETSAVSSSLSASQAKAAAIEASSSANSAALSSATASAAAGQAEAAVSAAVVGAVLTGAFASAIASAENSASSAQNSADDAKVSENNAKRSLTELQNQAISIQGDINGSGIINTGILNANFSQNPSFQGTYMVIPGTNQQRPFNNISGMLRFNNNL